MEGYLSLESYHVKNGGEVLGGRNAESAARHPEHEIFLFSLLTVNHCSRTIFRPVSACMPFHQRELYHLRLSRRRTSNISS